MKPIAIIRHVPYEGPGYLEQFLQARNIPWQLIAVDGGDAIPDDCRQYAAVVMMGGPMSVNDDLPWIAPELALIRQADALGIPLLGHCLGGQLISKALGGDVLANAVEEIGWHEIDCLPGSEEWTRGLPKRFEAFHWHGERFTLPEGAQAMFANDHCPLQGFFRGNTVAMQCHIEMTSSLIDDWLTVHRDHLAANHSTTVQSATEILDDLDERLDRLQRTADQLYERWLARVTAAGC